MESENSSICICCLKLSMFSNFMSLLYFLIFSLSCRDMSLYSNLWTLHILRKSTPFLGCYQPSVLPTWYFDCVQRHKFLYGKSTISSQINFMASMFYVLAASDQERTLPLILLVLKGSIILASRFLIHFGIYPGVNCSTAVDPFSHCGCFKFFDPPPFKGWG